jgi:hypothetical protein
VKPEKREPPALPVKPAKREPPVRPGRRAKRALRERLAKRDLLEPQVQPDKPVRRA